MKATFTVLACLAILPLSAAARAKPFDGAYVGSDIGYEKSGRLDDDGITYGIFAGYDARLGSNIVLGVEAQIGDSAVSKTVVRNTSTHRNVADSSIGFGFGAALRAGLLVTSRTLVFARGGWERIDVKSVLTRTPLLPAADPTPTVSDFSFRDHVVIVGVGTEQALGQRWRMRLGYDYADRTRRHQVRLGVIAVF